MRMEKETSGGCIDPKTLAALLSSVTSVRYQLDALGVEKVCHILRSVLGDAMMLILGSCQRIHSRIRDVSYGHGSLAHSQHHQRKAHF